MQQDWIRWLRGMVATIGIAGGLVFSVAFVWSFVDPVGVEKRARDAIQAEAVEQIDAGLDVLTDSGIGAIAQRLAAGKRQEAQRIRDFWRSRALQMVAELEARRHDVPCECTARLPPEMAVEVFIGRLELAAAETMKKQEARLLAMVESKYAGVAAAMLREFRIFAGTNALVLFLLAAAALARRDAGWKLLPAAVLVVVGSAYVSWSYLFKQDWLHTILFGDYIGFGFVGYVATVAFILWDVVLNRARLARYAPGMILLFLLFVFIGMR